MDPVVELELAVRAVRRAAQACGSIRASLAAGETISKADNSPVTVADFASQALICRAIARESTATNVVGEENADALRDADELRDRVVHHVAAAVGESVSADDVLTWIDMGRFEPRSGDRYWTVDPIDGTKGFVRGGHYAIALALINAGRVELAALACPRWDVALCASRGTDTRQLDLKVGASMAGTPVRVSDAGPRRFCESFEPGHSDQVRAAVIAQRLGIDEPALRMDSQAKYAAVARGDSAIYLRLPTRSDRSETIWDHAAGMLLCEQAGGRVTDIHGRALDFGHGRGLAANTGIIASNGAFHDDIVDAARNSA